MHNELVLRYIQKREPFDRSSERRRLESKRHNTPRMDDRIVHVRNREHVEVP